MKKVILSVFAALVSTSAIAGGGGEEIPFVPAPVAAVEPMVVPTMCDSYTLIDTPRITEMWNPETRWQYNEWRGTGWNPFAEGYAVDWTEVVMEEPDSFCEHLGREVIRQKRDIGQE